MQARIQEQSGVTIVSLQGYLDFESVSPFRRFCQNILAGKRVIFDLKDLSFVGSSGVTTFVEIMREYRASAPTAPRFSGVSSEFKRLFTTSHLSGVELFESNDAALAGVRAEVIPDWIENADVAAVVDAPAVDAVTVPVLSAVQDFIPELCAQLSSEFVGSDESATSVTNSKSESVFSSKSSD